MVHKSGERIIMRRLRLFIFALLCLPIMTLPLLHITAQEFGSNWSLTYYNSTNLSGTPVTTVTADRLDIAGASALPPNVNASAFSLQARTGLTFSEGTYRFTLGANDGAKLTVDGQSVIDNFTNRGSYIASNGTVYFAEGQHALQVDYVQEGGGDVRLVLSWEKLSDTNISLPTATPGPIQPTPVPAPAGQVTVGSVLGAEGLSVRSGPYLGASRLDIIAPGAVYPVFSRNSSEGVYTWYYIEVQDFIEVADDTTGQIIRQPFGSPQRGWVSGRYFVPEAQDAAIPIAGTVFDGLTNPAPTGVQGVLRSNMRLRAGPSYRTPTLQILDWGAEVEIVGRTIQARQNHWFQVIYNGQVGWLFAPFITINGDINSVPTY